MERPAPAFFYALMFLVGTACGLAFHWSYFIPAAAFLWFNRKRVISGILMCLSGLSWSLFAYSLPNIPSEGLVGKGVFHIESITRSQSPFQTSIVYKGILKTFNEHTKIPCRLYQKSPIENGSYDLLIEGKLLSKGPAHYVLKPTSMEPLFDTHTQAQWRFEIKNKLRSYLKVRFQEPKTAAFLLSMVTGEIDDRLLSLEFNRLGLLHLLGISGFQFALLAFLLGLILRIFLPRNISYIALMIVLTAYAYILGDSPPIERAWLGTILYLISLLFGFPFSALNALGLAALMELIKDPLLIFHLGFQFSFLCTAAILLVYPLFRSALAKIFPIRSFKNVTEMSLLDQHGYLLSTFCRESLALNGAIHLVTLPLIFYHFHKFPLLSLLYNLFLPVGVSVVYLLLLIGTLLDFSLFHTLTQSLSTLILHIAMHPPALYDFQWRVGSFSMTLTILFLTVIFSMIVMRLRRSTAVTADRIM